MTVEGTTRGTVGRRIVIGSVMLGMFLTAIEISIVATAAPAIVSKLGGLAELTWVFSAFLLAQAVFLEVLVSALAALAVSWLLPVRAAEAPAAEPSS